MRPAERGFSGSISLVRDHQMVLETSRGMADRELGIANDPTTVFDVGSIMKDVTAVAVYRLEAEGKLSRIDTLDRWFDVPADKAAITIDQLLTHRAGLHEYHDVTPLAWGERFHNRIFVSRPAMQLIAEAGGQP